MQNISTHFIEIYNHLKDVTEEEFPPGERRIECKMWDDDTFTLTAIYHRNDWECGLRIASEEACVSSEIKHFVQHDGRMVMAEEGSFLGAKGDWRRGI